eukprot:scaffold2908_cov257-Pinguiococcus_pyrenoidosus.AAC.35
MQRESGGFGSKQRPWMVRLGVVERRDLLGTCEMRKDPQRGRNPGSVELSLSRAFTLLRFYAFTQCCDEMMLGREHHGDGPKSRLIGAAESLSCKAMTI